MAQGLLLAVHLRPVAVGLGQALGICQRVRSQRATTQCK